MSETMTRSERIEGIVESLVGLFETGELAEHAEDLDRDFDALGKIIIGALAKCLPGLTGEEIHTAFAEVNRRIMVKSDRTAAAEADMEFHQRIAALGDGLPDHMMIGDVVKLRADQGNEFALWLLANPHELDREITVYPEGGIQ